MSVTRVDRPQDLPDELHRVSGVYVIRSLAGNALYVGESHTNQLKKTILRHFQKWPRDHFHKEPRAVYNESRVRIIVEITTAGQAIDRQNALICRLNPRDNLAIPSQCQIEPDPF